MQHLLDRIDELEEEVRQLRAVLAPTTPLPNGLHLSPTERRIIEAIVSTDLAHYDRIFMACDDMAEDRPMTGDTLKVHVHRIRHKLKPYGLHIETVHAVGYAMPERDRQRFANARRLECPGVWG